MLAGKLSDEGAALLARSLGSRTARLASLHLATSAAGRAGLEALGGAWLGGQATGSSMESMELAFAGASPSDCQDLMDRAASKSSSGLRSLAASSSCSSPAGARLIATPDFQGYLEKTLFPRLMLRVNTTKTVVGTTPAAAPRAVENLKDSKKLAEVI
mmetsp:Transcript_63136/g.104981  ORF Transcript_63136/g.104981 Transcript_63136/m.104981 type:complete len:158 (+) Transcript_63136:3-476(+)